MTKMNRRRIQVCTYNLKNYSSTQKKSYEKPYEEEERKYTQVQ